MPATSTITATSCKQTSKVTFKKTKDRKTAKILAAKEQYVPLLREMKPPRHGYDYCPMIYECDLCE